MNCQKCGFKDVNTDECPSCGCDTGYVGGHFSKITIQAIKCPNCHGELELAELNDIIKCSFCGSNVVINEIAGRKFNRNNENIGKTKGWSAKLIKISAVLLLIGLAAGWHYYFKTNQFEIGAESDQSVTAVNKSSGKFGTITTAPYQSMDDPGGWIRDLPSAGSVAIDPSGNIYALCQNNGNVVKFNSSGKLILKWGSYGNGNGQMSKPFGITADLSGSIYIAEPGNHRIQKFDSNGNYLLQWGSLGSDKGQFNYVSGIAVDSSGNRYAADTYNSRIQVFDSNNNFIREWGSCGQDNGNFNGPVGIAVNSSKKFVYVADTLNHRIQKFDLNGNFITKWGNRGMGDGQFDSPDGVAVDSSGNLYVADGKNHRIQKFDSNGNFIAMRGGFNVPVGIAVDPSGFIYVTDWSAGNIKKISPLMAGNTAR
ncbi:MAG TPA: SMP-30/gluconolactonase/LRE family protein [Candidatus Wallbacteria bacterium]|nr:SMP-30/gluconolactonase/LRE family protein [Candidatus Wallbacteria bacterium]